MMHANFPFRLTFLAGGLALLAACHSIIYQPAKTIKQIDLQRGYRLENTMQQALQKENLVIMAFSGGGSRAASLGYGVLEQFKNASVRPTEKGNTLLQNIDVVYGVSGGSVLAAYFALEGQDVIPKFNESFLKKDFQKKVINEVFSMSNVPRLTSPQFGRSDLLQEQLNLALYKGKKFADQWNAYTKRKKDVKIKIYFVNLSLRNLPEGQLKTDVLHIGTSFYLPESDVDKLREAAKILLEQ
ncbi:patatin-like phospholipase family protein [Aggregatibacter actinomycetemcomitans]|uniref:patatin-like phospholipase family protein n=1 Tax=Aggregatibacter actinomycetemcomitans TaxID=714 RepID=UPI00022AD220|nr:patatin-like phospholipase family protein [Aggregatibacter actinomycetemcomitans]KYK78820.1 hypothetical protein SA2876_03245 [Aggregatibacter actinomycetemcomitans serotype e str. SA2876]